ncbi:MAG TPA: DNA mismatch repair protein MutS [Mollicutes bacterium]|nr:DNA mismatch repair protein MutS [Mollicutes bacterium]
MKSSEVNYNKLSPMMKQYMDIKKNYKEVFLFYRVGDFYELFFEDAINASRELDITLTGKSAGLEERVPMAGVPHHSVRSYIDKLLNKGFKVAVCDQMEDAKEAKGMVRREVTEVLSKGTVIDADFLAGNDFNYIGSILNLNNNYILTYADVSTGLLYSETLSLNNEVLLNRILNLNLKEIIIEEDFDLELINTLKNNYNIGINIINEFYEETVDILDNINDSRVKIGVNHLLYYLITIQLKDITHFNNVIIKDNSNYLLMDVHTVRNLEIFETLRLKERKYSLLWLLDACKNSMGSRTLKEFLMNPLINRDKINKRLDYIETLNNQFILRTELQDALYEIYDLERLCAKITSNSLNARDVLQIKKSLKVLPLIKDIVNQLKFDFDINTHIDLYNLLDQAIYEEPPVTIKEGYIIKDGYNKELDELKDIRKNAKKYLSSLEQKERERSNIPNLKIGYNKVFGYYLEVSKSHISKVKPEFGWERKQTLTTGERYITSELKEKEAKILNAEDKIVELEYELFIEIKEILKQNIKTLKETSSQIGYLDAITSLSVVSEKYNLVRPTFNNKNEVNIKNGFHPVVNIVSEKEFVKNDCIINNGVTTLLITGPNMSGKSTYMRQLAIIVIMAQIGSFVPADEANLPIFDQIFTRIGASDDLVSGESTFMVEMLEAKNAITSATKNSLILFDELGRGTATYDGMAIAESILEFVNKNIGAITLFSTHYHELTEMEKKFNSILNVHVSATLENNELIFMHKIKKGAVDKSYGVHVASLAGMPLDVIKRANELLSLYENQTPSKENVQLSFDFEEKNLLKERLETIDPLKVTPMEAINILYELKEISKE